MSPIQVGGIYSRDRFDDWQKSLIYEKGLAASDQLVAAINQQQLETVVEAGPRRVREYLLERLGVVDRRQAEDAVPRLPNPLTVAEMQKLPVHAEREIAMSLKDITPVQAADPAFWTLCHAIWIGNWMFDADVAAVFMEGGRAGNSEQRTRNFLRRLGGLHRVRGSVSVLTDCPISAAWWRYRTAVAASRQASEHGTVLSVVEAHQVLQRSQVWENLAGWSVKRVTSLNAPYAKAAVISVLARHDLTTNGAKPQQQIQSVMRSVAQLGHTHSLFGIEWQQLVHAAEGGLAKAGSSSVIDDDEESGD
ncbi:MAG: hypothetical protein F4124_04310 [Acidimicrobiia bacterium]|nr:hypothetical protein [Acidimicrobiia bacterium]MYC57023.1 hypothetical protein [Acidimicrobiia bacterium]MYH98635.1 hypothetical protein [Acidimicrobiia bacterium]